MVKVVHENMERKFDLGLGKISPKSILLNESEAKLYEFIGIRFGSVRNPKHISFLSYRSSSNRLQSK